MKKYLLLCLLLLTGVVFAQKNYTKGYMIDNSGQRTECYINDSDFDTNPEIFEYRLTLTDKIQTGGIKDYIEFGTDNMYVFKRYEVDVDISKSNMSNLSNDRNLIYEGRVVYLNVLVSGEATLYSYNDDGKLKFFFSVNSSMPKQLEFKEFLYQSDVVKNNNYKQQLFNAMKNGNVSEKDISGLTYRSASLVSLFNKYNGLVDNDKKLDKLLNRKYIFNFYIKAGVQNTSLYVNTNSDFIGVMDFDKVMTSRVGFEAEFIFPFYNKKWAMYLEAYYLKYKQNTNSSIGSADIDYQTIEIPAGLKYNFYLSKKSRLYVAGGIQLGVPLKTYFKIEHLSSNYGKFSYVPNFNYSIGYLFNNKFGVALNFMTNRDITVRTRAWPSKYTNSSITLSYRLF